jgi:hypothetical protein
MVQLLAFVARFAFCWALVFGLMLRPAAVVALRVVRCGLVLGLGTMGVLAPLVAVVSAFLSVVVTGPALIALSKLVDGLLLFGLEFVDRAPAQFSFGRLVKSSEIGVQALEVDGDFDGLL